MQMQVDEARDDQVAGRIDRLRRRRGKIRVDGRNPSALDGDIDGLLAAAQPGIANDKIGQVRSRMCRPRVRSMR
jgi:hypothetical protein